MKEPTYSKETIDAYFNRIDEKLDEHGETHRKILEQVIYTNGKVKKLYFWMTVVGTATLTILFTNGSELADFVFKII